MYVIIFLNKKTKLKPQLFLIVYLRYGVRFGIVLHVGVADHRQMYLELLF